MAYNSRSFPYSIFPNISFLLLFFSKKAYSAKSTLDSDRGEIFKTQSIMALYVYVKVDAARSPYYVHLNIICQTKCENFHLTGADFAVFIGHK